LLKKAGKTVKEVLEKVNNIDLEPDMIDNNKTILRISFSGMKNGN
jgi:hypothetical protein